MTIFKFWAVVLIAILLPSGVALSTDPAKEAYEKEKACFQKKDYDGAVAAYTESSGGPKNAETYYKRALAYLNKQESDKAIADCTEAIRLNPKYGRAYDLRGMAYRIKGDLDKAIVDFTEAIRLDPKDATTYESRGYAYLDKSEYDKAIADCTEAIHLDSKLARAYCWRGVAYEEKSEHDKAIADLTEAIRLDPKYATAYARRGEAYGRKGRVRQGNCRLHRSHPAQPKIRLCVLQPRHRLREKG